MTHQFLSHDQLVTRVSGKGEKIKSLTLSDLNNNKKLRRMCRNVELHERILSCIQVNNINRLNAIVKTCLENNHSIKSTKYKKYNPHHTVENIELSILILQFGGPSLLEILHRAK